MPVQCVKNFQQGASRVGDCLGRDRSWWINDHDQGHSETPGSDLGADEIILQAS